LQSLKKFREGREILYMDETCVHSSLTFKKCWRGDDEVNGVMTSISSLTDLCVAVHNGSSNCITQGAGLAFKPGNASGDYHGQVNEDNFDRQSHV
jgi:hypothetical protein